MLSWKALSLVVAAVVAMNGVVGLEQGYGGGIWTTAPPTDAPTTAPPTSTESSSDQQSACEEYSQSIDDSTDSDVDPGSQVEGSSGSDEGSDVYTVATLSPDSSYGNSLSWDGSKINGGSGSFPGGKITSGDGSVYIEVPSGSEDGSQGSSVDVPAPSGSGSIDVPPGKGAITRLQAPPAATETAPRKVKTAPLARRQLAVATMTPHTRAVARSALVVSVSGRPRPSKSLDDSSVYIEVEFRFRTGV